MSLGELAGRVRRIEAGRSPRGGPMGAVSRALAGAVAGVLPGAGVVRGALQEWLSESPPQAIWIELAGRAAESGGSVYWVGRACWPYAVRLGRGRAGEAGLLRRSVLVDTGGRRPRRPPRRGRHAGARNGGAGGEGGRLWALDVVLRSGSAAAVIGDGRGLGMAASRRLQLAAEAGGALALLWRRPDEAGVISAARYRWRVEPAVSPGKHPRWRVERVRGRDAAAWTGQGGPGHGWELEDRGGAGVVVVPAELADRPGAAAPEPAVRRRA